MTALPEQTTHDILFSPQGMLSVLQRMPQFQEKQMALIAENLQTLESRKQLAKDIALHIQTLMPDADKGDTESVETRVLAQLDELQRMLSMSKAELVEKTKRMTSLEQSPEKKGLLSRATESIQNGWQKVKNHKGKIALALVAIAAGVAAWYYWDYLALLFRGGLGGAGAAGAEQMTHPEVVGNAVKLSMEEAAKHAKVINTIEHDIIFNGVPYNVKVPAEIQKLTEVIHAEVAKDPKALFNLIRSETSRASAEAAVDTIFSTLPKGSGSLMTSGKFLEDLGASADALPQ